MLLPFLALLICADSFIVMIIDNIVIFFALNLFGIQFPGCVLFGFVLLPSGGLLLIDHPSVLLGRKV